MTKLAYWVLAFGAYVAALFGLSHHLRVVPAGTPRTAPAAQTFEEKLTDLIIKTNIPMPPIPPPLGTGGEIHKNSPETSALMAKLIVQEAARVKRDPVVIAAWIAGESRFDPTAFNPNLQHSVKGETPEDIFNHTDLGLGQISGRWLFGMAGMENLTWEQQRAKAFDPEWSVPQVVTKMDGLLTWADKIAHNYGGYADKPEMLAFEAYNKGQHGCLLLVGSGEPLTYAEKVTKRIADFRAALA